MNYAIMTFLFNFFELGCFLWAMQVFGLESAAIIAVCSKVGRMCTETIRSRTTSIVIGVFLIGVILGALSLYYNWLLACLAAPMTVYSISKLRESYQSIERPPKKFKVFSRLMAFCIAPLFNFWILIPFAVYFAVKMNNVNINERSTALFPDLGNYKWEYTLLNVHHIHYFAYSYVVPYLASEVFNIDMALVGIIFVIGWGAYNLYEGRIDSKISYVAYGHLIAGVGVGLIWFFTHNFLLVMFGWFLTGLGGGTFYIIKDKLPPDIGKSEVVELWGQLIGMFLFALAVNINNFEFIYYFAIIFAIATTVIANILSKRCLLCQK